MILSITRHFLTFFNNIKKFKINYYNKLITNSTKNSTQTWKVINDIAQLKKDTGQ